MIHEAYAYSDQKRKPDNTNSNNKKSCKTLSRKMKIKNNANKRKT